MSNRKLLDDRDRRFLEKHKALAESGPPTRRGSTGDRTVEISGVVREETELALKIFDGNRTQWVPKSQIKRRDETTFEIAEWIAKDKGFI